MPQTSAQVTAAEISRLAGVTRATVSNWRRRHPDFPAPTGGTDASPAYDLGEVRAWLTARGQLPETSAADDLRAAIRAVLPGDIARLLALVLAASGLGEAELKAIVDLPDDEIRQRAREITKARVADVPGAEDRAYKAGEADLVRTLLRCVHAEGPVAAVEVVAEHDGDDTGASGAYQTPTALAELMADLLVTPGEAVPASVFDPACGTGNLLVAAAQRGATELYGQDLVPTAAAQAAVRLAILAPDATCRVEVGDSLRADAFGSLVAEAVLCAPPYGDRDWGHEQLAYDPRWMFGLPPKSEPELAWVQHCLAHLAPGAAAVLLMPPSTAERPAGRRTRAALLREGALRAVIALPTGIAAPFHVGLHLWLLRRPDPARAAPASVLFVDTADASRKNRREVDVSTLRGTVLDTWRAYLASPDSFATVPGTARAVPILDLLDETTDLTPARHVRAAPVVAPPRQHAETARELGDRLNWAAMQLARLSSGDSWMPTGDTARSWRTATVGDLLRGGALTMLRATGGSRGGADTDVEVQPGDVILPELLQRADRSARVADERDAGQPLGRNRYLLRPDPQRLDPWFLAGFLSADENVHAAATGTSIVRVDARRLRVPLLPLDEQRRYGEAFRRLNALRTAADLANRLADDTVRALATGLTAGALLPPDG
ncbi:MAG TPA: N-6 DNA methylase [Micromonosporaceae bacterium]